MEAYDFLTIGCFDYMCDLYIHNGFLLYFFVTGYFFREGEYLAIYHKNA